MYDFEWHKVHGEKTALSARQVLSILREAIPCESLLDVGCGDGSWLAVGRELGCPVVQGVDGPWTKLDALLIPAQDVTICDLAERFELHRRFDAAISLEVAEHVDPASADIFVDNLVGHSDVVVFGAAIPFQGGFRHINEQWQSFWKERFEARGYVCRDLIRPQIWQQSGVHYWYKQNILVYVSDKRRDLIEAIDRYMAERGIAGFPPDMVHPEKYEAIASYEQIAFRPLARRLPGQLSRKLQALATGRL